MAEFLSQKEIDALLGVGMTSDDLPIYAHIERDNKFGIITIDEPFLKSKLDIDIQNSDVDIDDVISSLADKNITILQHNRTKKELVMQMHDELETFKKRTQEMKHIKKYLDEHPEYLL